jgi:signal transduction histidine kinase
MDTLIKAVLRLSRIGHMELQNEAVDLDQLTRSIIDSVHHEIEQAQGQVVIEPLPTITADRGAIGQIIANLVSNAIKYRRPRVPLELRIWADVGEPTVTLHVADNGRGMTAEDIPRAFEPFHRVGTQDTEGEGMGLPYVQGLVRRCGGNINCESTPDEGSVFHVRLPLAGISHERDARHA